MSNVRPNLPTSNPAPPAVVAAQKPVSLLSTALKPALAAGTLKYAVPYVYAADHSNMDAALLFLLSYFSGVLVNNAQKVAPLSLDPMLFQPLVVGGGYAIVKKYALGKGDLVKDTLSAGGSEIVASMLAKPIAGMLSL